MKFVKSLLLFSVFISTFIVAFELFEIIDSPIAKFTYLKDILILVIFFFLNSLFIIVSIKNKIPVKLLLLFFIYILIIVFNLINGFLNKIPIGYIFNEFRLQLIYLSLLYLIPFFLYYLDSNEYENKLYKFYFVSIFISCVIGILEFAILSRLEFYHIVHNAIVQGGKGFFDKRIFSTFLNPNNFSQGILLAIFLFIAYSPKTKNKLFKFFVLGILIIALLLTQSKTALVSFFSMLILLSLFSIKMKYRFKIRSIISQFIFIIIPIIVAVVIFILANSEYFSYRLNENIFASFSKRLLIWKELLSRINILFGQGLGFIYISETTTTIDSGIFKLLFEGGVLNLILYLVYFSLPLFERIWTKYHKLYFIILLIFLIGNITLPVFWLFPLSLHFSFIFGLVSYKVLKQNG